MLHNRDDEQAERRLIVINRAYQVLTGDGPCRSPLEREPAQPTLPDHETYHLDDACGHVLWWRATFFGYRTGARLEAGRSSVRRRRRIEQAVFRDGEEGHDGRAMPR